MWPTSYIYEMCKSTYMSAEIENRLQQMYSTGIGYIICTVQGQVTSYVQYRDGLHVQYRDKLHVQYKDPSRILSQYVRE